MFAAYKLCTLQWLSSCAILFEAYTISLRLIKFANTFTNQIPTSTLVNDYYDCIFLLFDLPPNRPLNFF